MIKTGTIVKAMSGFYYVETDAGTIECRARGRFRLDKTHPLVGDRVELSRTEQGRGVITKILPRKNTFMRPPIANLDIMVIIASGAIPVTDPYLIDRMTAISEKNNCQSVICINKCDLDSADSLYEIYDKAGFATIRTSAETGEGLSQLLDTIKNKLCAFTGNSGVGKSSILNVLDPSFKINVGVVSQKLGRGRHTTRHVELYKLQNSAIIADTPGFSSFDTGLMGLASKEQLQYLFPDFEPHLGKCRFLDCMHMKEPGCAILESVETGKIQKSRYNSYVRLFEQAKELKEWERDK